MIVREKTKTREQREERRELGVSLCNSFQGVRIDRTEFYRSASQEQEEHC
jgi:hypothetical protein